MLDAAKRPSTRERALVVRANRRRDAGRKRRFAPYKKISFHHTLKIRLRQPRARRNNATFLAKILAFSTKPSVSVVFLSKIALRRSIRRLFNAANVRKAQTGP
jgi:hypothetical protein